jgi:hypothetical protein
VALGLVLIAALAPAAQARWGRPFQFAAPGTLDDLAPQLAFSPSGASAAAFGIEDVDTPGVSQAYLTTRSSHGAVAGPRRIGGASQILALSFVGGAVEMLTGSSPSDQTCCSSAQAVQLSAGGQLARARTIVGGLTGATLGRLLILADGQMLAAVATERGVWVVQSSSGNRFAGQHLISGAGQLPESMTAAWLGGESTAVAWTAGRGPAGASDPRTIYLATGSRNRAPGRARVALTIASGHRIDELGLARRATGATLAWIESWYDGRGDYHSQVRAADIGAHPVVRALSPVSQLASGLTFAAGPGGDQGLSWLSCTTQATCHVDVVVGTGAGSLGAIRALGATDASQSPALSVGPRGRVIVGWIRGGQPMASVGSATSGGFGSPTALSSTLFAADLTVGFGPGREALVAWTQGTLNPSVVGAAYQAP